MTKQEFLTTLRGKLTSKIPQEEVESNLDYYNAYIDGEIRKGRSEEEVMDELGSPELIAKTLSESFARLTENDPSADPRAYSQSADYTDYSQSSDSGYSGGGYTDSGYSDGGPYYSGDRGNYYSDDNGQYYSDQEQNGTGSTGGGKGFLIAGLVLIVIFVLLFLIFGFVLRLGFGLIRYCWPVLIVLLVLGFFARRSR